MSGFIPSPCQISFPLRGSYARNAPGSAATSSVRAPVFITTGVDHEPLHLFPAQHGIGLDRGAASDERQHAFQHRLARPGPRQLIDEACRITLATLRQLIGEDVLANADGTIDEGFARDVDTGVGEALQSALGSSSDTPLYGRVHSGTCNVNSRVP